MPLTLCTARRGLSADCSIDTTKPFSVAIDFTPYPTPFGFNVTLSQPGRTANYGAVEYSTKPTKGDVPTADLANADLRQKLDAGMTLVVSHWAGGAKKVSAIRLHLCPETSLAYIPTWDIPATRKSRRSAAERTSHRAPWRTMALMVCPWAPTSRSP